MRVFPFPCELQLLKPRQPQLASWICWVCAVAFAFQANDGSDEGSQKSPFETKVRIKGLAELLRQNIVTRVFLDGLDDEQVKALADAIRVNKTMTRVSLDKNNFGNDGLKARAPRRGPLLRGRGMVKGRRSWTLSLGSSVSWAIFLLQTAVRQ
eukprot:symbB.v1.2.030530.t1/scaffold3451.1/size56373/1